MPQGGTTSNFSHGVDVSDGTNGGLYVNGTRIINTSGVPSFASISASDASLDITGLAAAQGGVVALTGGTSSTGANAGGAVTATGGTPGATGVGGACTLAAGAGGATSGAGGVASLTGGAGTAGNSAGGVSRCVGGAGSGSSAGGAAQLTGGAGGATGAGGAAQLTGGAGGATSGTGGAATITGGAGTAGNSAGGAASVTGGAGQGTGAGGAASLVGGASGTGATGAGGAANVTGGAALSTNDNGGGVVLTPGAGNGTGFAGLVRAVGAFGRKGARQTIANAGTISDAETIAGVLYQDASGGNVTMTTRTGTQLASAFPGLATGEYVKLHCASNHATNTSTIAGGTDVTLVGSGAVTNTGGQFLLIKTGATTFDLVRVG
jgi:hypothetical protein